MYCKFEYTKRYEKVSKVFDYVYFVYAALLVLIVINNFLLKIVNPTIAVNVMFGAIAFIAIIQGFLDIYKTKSISLPSIDFTLQYNDINQDDPLQTKVVSQAVEFATSWASFALKREKRKIELSATYELIFGVSLLMCLIF